MKVVLRKRTKGLRHRQSSGAQRGVALITALLVVALTTVAAVTVASRQELDVRRTSNLIEADQAYAYALGVETWAQVILERDLEDSQNDHLGEAWATVIPPIAVAGGQVAGRIEDLQGRFNINGLLEDNKPNEPRVQQFERLLKAVGLDRTLAQTLLDWMDPDIDRRFPDGAEDENYLGAKPAYRAANGPLMSISELRLVKGFDAKAMAVLAPHISALDKNTTLNVNTATVMVLRSLADQVSQIDAERLVEDRGEEGYKMIEDFLKHPALAGRKVDRSTLSLDSQYFLLHAEAKIGNVRTRMYSAIYRGEEGIKILMRTRGIE